MKTKPVNAWRRTQRTRRRAASQRARRAIRDHVVAALKAVVQLMPGSRHLVLSLERRFEQAGTLHQQEDAAVVDPKTCTASTSFGEAAP